MAEAVVQSNIPVVNVSQADAGSKLPSIYVDEEAHGHMALQHLLDRGFKQFAFCSVGGHTWSTPRCQAFVVAVQEAGFSCHIYKPAGYEAAALLDRLMQGEPMQGQRVLVQPIGVHARQSTDIIAIEDSEVAAAVRHIRERACDGINVNDVLARIPLVRQTFEHRFR